MNAEIEELKNAVALSPENMYLRLMLIRKMQYLPHYANEFEAQLNELLKIDSSNIEGKELLAGLYLQKGKTSTAIIILEELDSSDELSIRGKTILSKAYLKEENFERAKELYQMVLLLDPQANDDELDTAFRVQETKKTRAIG